MAAEPVRILEEALACHGEELGRAFGGIVVERQAATLVEQLVEAIPAGGNTLPPPATRRRGVERGRSVDLTAAEIKEVGALVDDYAPRTVPHPRPVPHAGPGEHHAASPPCFAKPCLLPLEFSATGKGRDTRHEVIAGVDQNRLEPIEPLILEPEH